MDHLGCDYDPDNAGQKLVRTDAGQRQNYIHCPYQWRKKTAKAVKELKSSPGTLPYWEVG